MAKDYSYLEGKQFTFFNGAENVLAKVLYADYEIGLTCVLEFDSDEYLICLQGPSSPNPLATRKNYQRIWVGFIKRIENGYVNGLTTRDLLNRCDCPQRGRRGPDSNNCAFNQ